MREMGLSDAGMAPTVSEGSPVRLLGVHGRDLPRPTQADYIRMILGCGRTVVPCQFRGTLRLCVRIEGIAAVQRAYGFYRNLDGTPSLAS